MMLPLSIFCTLLHDIKMQEMGSDRVDCRWTLLYFWSVAKLGRLISTAAINFRRDEALYIVFVGGGLARGVPH